MVGTATQTKESPIPNGTTTRIDRMPIDRSAVTVG